MSANYKEFDEVVSGHYGARGELLTGHVQCTYIMYMYLCPLLWSIHTCIYTYTCIVPVYHLLQCTCTYSVYYSLCFIQTQIVCNISCTVYSSPSVLPCLTPLFMSLSLLTQFCRIDINGQELRILAIITEVGVTPSLFFNVYLHSRIVYTLIIVDNVVYVKLYTRGLCTSKCFSFCVTQIVSKGACIRAVFVNDRAWYIHTACIICTPQTCDHTHVAVAL